MNTSSLLHATWNTILDLVYPPYCVCCDQRLKRDESLACGVCWQKNNFTGFLKQLDRRTIKLYRREFWTLAGTAYSMHDGALVLIHEAKYGEKLGLVVRMGNDAGIVILQTPPLAQADWIVPVPLHPARERERGYNQSAILARTASDVCGIPVLKDVLRRKRNNPSQTGLSYVQRHENVRGIFNVCQASVIQGQKVVLMDDVLTTGATMNECCRVLVDAGASDVYVLALFHPVPGKDS